MKLLSGAVFKYHLGQFSYLDRPVTSDSVNAKHGLTIVCNGHRIKIEEGQYTLQTLKTKVYEYLKRHE